MAETIEPIEIIPFQVGVGGTGRNAGELHGLASALAGDSVKLSVPITERRKCCIFAFVIYSDAAPGKTVAVTLRSALGAAWDIPLESILLTGTQLNVAIVFEGAEGLPMVPGDIFEITAEALAGETVAIAAHIEER